MEGYSEAKTYKGKSELRNCKILTIFIHQSGNNNYCQHGVCLRKTCYRCCRMLADMCASSLEYLM